MVKLTITSHVSGHVRETEHGNATEARRELLGYVQAQGLRIEGNGHAGKLFNGPRIVSEASYTMKEA